MRIRTEDQYPNNRKSRKREKEKWCKEGVKSNEIIQENVPKLTDMNFYIESTHQISSKLATDRPHQGLSQWKFRTRRQGIKKLSNLGTESPWNRQNDDQSDEERAALWDPMLSPSAWGAPGTGWVHEWANEYVPRGTSEFTSLHRKARSQTWGGWVISINILSDIQSGPCMTSRIPTSTDWAAIWIERHLLGQNRSKSGVPNQPRMTGVEGGQKWETWLDRWLGGDGEERVQSRCLGLCQCPTLASEQESRTYKQGKDPQILSSSLRFQISTSCLSLSCVCTHTCV